MPAFAGGTFFMESIVDHISPNLTASARGRRTFALIFRPSHVSDAVGCMEAKPECTSSWTWREGAFPRCFMYPAQLTAISATQRTPRQGSPSTLIATQNGPLVRVPGEGRGPVLTLRLVPLCGGSLIQNKP